MPRQTNSTSQVFDVIIVGADVIGTTLAWKLATDGFRVCLCDDAANPPRAFSTGHLSQQAAALYKDLGLFPRLKPLLSPLDYTAHFRNGRQNEITSGEDYAIFSERLVRMLQHDLEKLATVFKEPVVRISSKDRVKTVRFQSGLVICGWLLVVASEAFLRTQALPGLTEEVLSKDHSLNFAWDLELHEPGRMSYPALVFQTSRTRHGFEHLRIFRNRESLRANFFTYWSAEDSRGQGLHVGEASRILARNVEGFSESLGDFRVTSPVEESMSSLSRVHGGAEAGIVLAGNAGGQTPPVSELGLSKGLHEIKILASLTPGWLRERQLTPDVLATFYTNPGKTAFEQEIVDRCLYARNLATGRSAEWLARRFKEELPDWLETACLRGVQGGRWTFENLGLPAWRKGRELIQNYRATRLKGSQTDRSGRLLTSGHDDLASSDRFDDLVS